MSGGEEWVQGSCRGGIPNGESARNLPSVRQPFRATLHPSRRHSYASRNSGEGPATPGRGQGLVYTLPLRSPSVTKRKTFCISVALAVVFLLGVSLLLIADRSTVIAAGPPFS